jgi:hypothetical protein
MGRPKAIKKLFDLQRGGKLCPSCMGVFSQRQYEQHIGQPKSRCHHVLLDRLNIINHGARIASERRNEEQAEFRVSDDMNADGDQGL